MLDDGLQAFWKIEAMRRSPQQIVAQVQAHLALSRSCSSRSVLTVVVMALSSHMAALHITAQASGA
jgi:hypothetical protein